MDVELLLSMLFFIWSLRKARTSYWR